jgi:hypothetical protein
MWRGIDGGNREIMDRLRRINLKQLAGEALGFVLIIAVCAWSLSYWFRGFETPSPWLCAVLTSAAVVLVIGLPSTLRRRGVRVPHLGLLLSPLGILGFTLFLWPLFRHREPQAEFWQVYLAVGIVTGGFAGFGFLMDRLRRYEIRSVDEFDKRFWRMYRMLPRACRCVVVSDLADFRYQELAAFLLDEFGKEWHRNLRLALSCTLASWGVSTDGTRTFLESVAYSEDPDELGDGTAKALGALLKLEDESAIEELRELRGTNEIDQLLVYEPLVESGDEESIARLEESLPPRGEGVSWVVPPLVLARVGRQEALPALLELVDARDNVLAAAAARVLWRFPDEATVDLLKSLRRDSDGTVRRRACQSLAHIADSAVRRGDLLIESWAARGNLRWFWCHRRPFSG